MDKALVSCSESAQVRLCKRQRCYYHYHGYQLQTLTLDGTYVKLIEVSVTTDDFIPLLAIVIIQARMMRLGSNMFYLQRFRINSPKSDHRYR